MHQPSNEIQTDYTLKCLEKENRYLVISGDVYFAVDPLSYHILYHLKQKHSVPEIAERLNQLFRNSNISSEAVARILESKEICRIIHPSAAVEGDVINNYIRFKVNLLHPEKIHRFLNLLSVLFQNRLYNVLFTIAAVITIIFYLAHIYINRSLDYFNLNQLTVSDLVFVFVAYHAIIFIHEIGHAAAAYKNSMTSKSIGFGFYFIFPVFYTELTAIWGLPRSQRIQVNMAGIYFQLLINLLLLFISYLAGRPPAITVLLILNITSILASFNPFFRYDGYWIVSDYLNIPNLKVKSAAFLHGLLQFTGLKKSATASAKPTGYPLMVYSLLNLLFWAWVYFQLARYCIDSIKALRLAAASGSFDFSAITNSCILVFILIFLLTPLLNHQPWKKRSTSTK